MYNNTATPSTTPMTRRLLYRAPAANTPTIGSKPLKLTIPTPSTTSITRAEAVGDLPPSVLFDELMRNHDHFINYSSEIEFLEFINAQEECRKKWYASEQEVLRLKIEAETHRTEQQCYEKQRADFRRQFETKLEVISRLESEIETRRSRINSALNLSRTYLTDPRLPSEARDKVNNILAALEGQEIKRDKKQLQSPGGGLDTISEAETTDLSITQSEDDLDYSVRRRTRGQSKRRSNDVHLDQDYTRKKVRTTNGARHVIESSGNMQKVISKTIVSIPHGGGPVQTTSTLESIPSGGGNEKTFVSHTLQPSAPPITSESESEVHSTMPPSRYTTRSSAIANTESVESPRFGRTLSATSGSMKNHQWVAKALMQFETCGTCSKRIHFAKQSFKCKTCKAICHPDCKDKVVIPCIPLSTPSKGFKGIGVIADYTPSTHPMVPALIQHCVNEIEIRGLTTEGLYRVRGIEREIKELKDRFLKGKGVSNLSLYDPHVLCGCIKDFLRSLREPLIGRHFWRDFALATEIVDPKRRQEEVNRALEELPPPNQDTLAFVILHLQKVAEVEVVKMPLSNMSKIFGPTLIGYTAYDLDAATMLHETKRQQLILTTLLNMAGEYWNKFLNRPNLIPLSDTNGGGTVVRPRRKRFSSVGRARGGTISGAVTSAPPPTEPVSNTVSVKKIYFEDASPKKSHTQRIESNTARPKRKFFD